jgi:filamentous hemagglutinin
VAEAEDGVETTEAIQVIECGAEEDSGSLGSTGRTVPENLNEQLAMQEAQSDPAAGTRLPITMTDPRWPAPLGWIKMARNINGTEIHYVYNTISGAADDFKFVP